MDTSDNDVCGPGLFDGLTAWFSTSVTKERQQLWIDNDGRDGEIDTAMYIFSEDAHSEDTRRIYDSDDYLHQHIAVFQASYIDECIHKSDLKQVAIGKYLLPNPHLQEGIDELKGQNWTKLQDKGNQHPVWKKAREDGIADYKKHYEQGEGDAARYDNLASDPVVVVDGYLQVEDLPQVKGPLCVLTPGVNGVRIITRK